MSHTKIDFYAVTILSTIFALSVGCSPKELKTDYVEGVVTMNGSPVEGATVTFSPKGGGPTALGKTDATGKYTLSSLQGGGVGKGALAGDYVVTIVKFRNHRACFLFLRVCLAASPISGG